MSMLPPSGWMAGRALRTRRKAHAKRGEVLTAVFELKMQVGAQHTADGRASVGRGQLSLFLPLCCLQPAGAPPRLTIELLCTLLPGRKPALGSQRPRQPGTPRG